VDLFEADVNYLAVILGALAVQPLGFVWYSQLFGARWMQVRGYSEEDVRGDASPAVYVVPLIVAAVIAYGLARLVDMVGADSVGDCIAVAAFVWVSFAATVQAGQINFSPHATNKVAVFGIEGGFQLASFVIIGAIVGAFQ
jgi:Protein of unknown function (DUF1761)